MGIDVTKYMFLWYAIDAIAMESYPPGPFDSARTSQNTIEISSTCMTSVTYMQNHVI